jgi:hypothetical protein
MKLIQRTNKGESIKVLPYGDLKIEFVCVTGVVKYSSVC